METSPQNVKKRRALPIIVRSANTTIIATTFLGCLGFISSSRQGFGPRQLSNT